MSNSKSILSVLVCVGMWAAATPQSHAQSPIVKPDILLDTADTKTGWAGHNTITVDTAIKVNGVASLKSVGNGKDRFRKTFPTTHDVSTMRFLTFWYYVDRPDLLGAATGDQGQIELTSSGTFDSQEQNWAVRDLHLQRGWNYVILDLPGHTRSSASPLDLTRINFLRIYHVPTGSVTTRIDQITFTDREPRSLPFAAYLDLKSISRSTAAVELEEGLFTFINRTRAGDAERAKVCRRLKIDLTQREISGFTLTGLGVTQAAVDNELREKRFIKELMCGERVMARAEILARLQARAATDIAVTGELASLFDLTMAAASETRQRILDVDLDRIMGTCGTKPSEVDTFIQSGALPPSLFQGVNVLVQNCSGSSAQIASSLGTLARPVNDRRAAYKQCMASFEQQGAQCDNPYASPDDDFNRSIDRIMYTDQQKADIKQKMRDELNAIRSITLGEARSMTDETHPRPDAPAAQRQQLENLHQQFDLERGKVDASHLHEGDAQDVANNPPVRDVPNRLEGTAWDAWRAAGQANAQRFRDEMLDHMGKMLDTLHDICVADPKDPQCNLSDDEWVPETAEVDIVIERTKRCADMDFGGTKTWFDRAPTDGLPTGQINESDRIDHCLCDLFERNYSNVLPGDQFANTGSCPSPEERVAQSCLENPYDGIDGIKAECRHLMQPISMDRDALGAKICHTIMPSCNAPYMESDGNCGCGTLLPTGNTVVPGCASPGIPNCIDGTPAADGCGCAPFDSGANACMSGGKDFYLARDPARDLLVRSYPSRPLFATDNLLLVKTGAVRFVTPAIKPSQLFSQSQLQIRAVLPGTVYDGSGQIKVSCTNTTSGTRNQLIETIAMSGLSTKTATILPINLSNAERTACFGNNPNSNVYFEFFVDSKVNQPVAFFDILGDLGNIKSKCTTFPPNGPTPGPRPLDDWPSRWTFSDGVVITPVFNGTGPIPIPPISPTLPPICVVDGHIGPCP
jgi:hypothetical protein